MSSVVTLTYPIDALVSYHFFRDPAQMDAVTAPGHLRLIGDSGAFSAYTQGIKITLPEYAKWCHAWSDRLVWMASLDVVGDPAASLHNWRALRDVHGLHTIPTVHVGTDPTWIGAYATEGVDFVGLGGMVGKDRSRPAVMRWAVAMLKHARDHYPHVRFHAWGQAGTGFMNALPVYSADSSRSAVAYRYGLLRLFDPRTGRHHAVQLDGGGQLMRHGRLLRDVYGVDPGLIRTSYAGNRRLLIRLAAAVIQQYAGWLRTRHQVPAPTWGVNRPPPVGPVIHSVSNVVTDYLDLHPDLPDERTPK